MIYLKVLGLALLIGISLSFIWSLGRFYGQTENKTHFYQRNSVTEDAYNYYLLTECLKGNLKLQPIDNSTAPKQ